LVKNIVFYEVFNRVLKIFISNGKSSAAEEVAEEIVDI